MKRNGEGMQNSDPLMKKIVTIVSDERRKNIQSLIEAHHLLSSEYHLDIIGNINPRHYKIFASQSKRVKFMGYVTETDKIKRLYEATVVCFP